MVVLFVALFGAAKQTVSTQLPLLSPDEVVMCYKNNFLLTTTHRQTHLVCGVDSSGILFSQMLHNVQQEPADFISILFGSARE